MRKLLITGVALALCLVAPAALAQQTDQIQLTEPQRGSGLLKFEILTPGGEPLIEEDFDITVNGLTASEVTITPTDEFDRPTAAVLVVDTSVSMAGEPIEQAKAAIEAFSATISPESQLGLIRFSDTVETLVDYTSDRDAMSDAVASIDAEEKAGGTPGLYAGLQQGIEMLSDRPGEQRNIVLLSDGVDVHDELEATLSSAADTGARIFIVALRSPDFTAENLEVFNQITTETSGELLEASNAGELQGIFRELAGTLATSYEVVLRDPDPGRKKVEIQIEVQGDDGVISGTRRFTLPTADTGGVVARSWVDDIPLPVLLVGLFLVVAAAAFLLSENVRRSKSSPAQRLEWYEKTDQKSEEGEQLLNAAVLDRAKEFATDVAKRAGLLERMESAIEVAGMKWRPGEIIVASIALAFTGLAVGWTLWGPWIGLAGFVVGGLGLIMWVKVKAAQRRKAFYEQLPDVLMLIGGALRSGYSLQQALAAAGEDSKPPSSDEFRRTMAEVRLGADLDTALLDLSNRLGIEDFEWVVLAIQIQREVGGNLAEILEIISNTIRERDRIRRQIRALTAEGRLSALILSCLPFVMAFFIAVGNPDYLTPLWTTTPGLVMSIGGVVLMVFGIIWMRKIIRIEV